MKNNSLIRQLFSSKYSIEYSNWCFRFVNNGKADFILDTTLPGYFNRVTRLNWESMANYDGFYETNHLNPIETLDVMWRLKKMGKLKLEVCWDEWKYTNALLRQELKERNKRN